MRCVWSWRAWFWVRGRQAGRQAVSQHHHHQPPTTIPSPPPQVLINCAGTSVSGAFDELVEEAFEDMYRVNVLGSVFPTRAVLPYMKRQRAGAIVFVSSQAGQVGLWGYSAYSASKFALRGLAQALQMEVETEGRRDFGRSGSVGRSRDVVVSLRCVGEKKGEQGHRWA